jgi:hypothetical protein
MRRTEFTYDQLDKLLRSLGFSCRLEEGPPTRVYEHKETGALLMIPDLPADELLYKHHLVVARVTLDQFGIIDAEDFDAKLRRTRRRKVHKSAE